MTSEIIRNLTNIACLGRLMSPVPNVVMILKLEYIGLIISGVILKQERQSVIYNTPKAIAIEVYAIKTKVKARNGLMAGVPPNAMTVGNRNISAIE